MDIRTVGVIGAGTMGNGIAHVFAKGGYNVVLVDVAQGFVDRGLQTISKNLEREVAKNKLTSEQRDVSARGRSLVQYFVHFDYQAGSSHQATGQSYRDAFF